MKIVYTNHAEFKLRKLKVPKIWVEETLRNPDLLIPEWSKHYALKKLNGLKLKIVYEKAKYIKIITLYFIK